MLSIPTVVRITRIRFNFERGFHVVIAISSIGESRITLRDGSLNVIHRIFHPIAYGERVCTGLNHNETPIGRQAGRSVVQWEAIGIGTTGIAFSF